MGDLVENIYRYIYRNYEPVQAPIVLFNLALSGASQFLNSDFAFAKNSLTGKRCKLIRIVCILPCSDTSFVIIKKQRFCE